MKNLQDLVRRTEELVRLAEATLPRHRGEELGPVLVDSVKFGELRAAALAFIERTFGVEHTYYREFSERCRDVADYRVEEGLGIPKAIHDELAGGWIETTRGLVTAEVFADFLEMAEHLLDDGYKDPAAVLVGGVLEDHLRLLAAARMVPVEETRGDGRVVARKADTINGELAKAGAYDKGDQKQVTAWLDLRNKAAHGRYSDYSKEQVALFLEGVRQFVRRVRP